MADERLIRKFLTDRMHITIDDCERLFSNYGYELHKGGGSHRTYHKRGAIPITIVAPKGKKYIKLGYVNWIIENLHLED